MKKPFKTIVYLNSGAIGEFLMTLYFADLVDQSAKEQRIPSPLIRILVQKNYSFLLQLAVEYPHIQIETVSSKQRFKNMLNARVGGTPRAVITQQTFGTVPLIVKLFAWLIALGPNAKLIGFDDGKAYNKFFYNDLLKFDSTLPFAKEMGKLAERCGYPATLTQPILRWKKLPSQKERSGPIVIHMCGTNPNRSFPIKRWNALLKELRIQYPKILFVCTGGTVDRPFIDAACEGVTNIQNAAGEMNVPELLDLFNTAKIFIGVDTGITHLASFRGVPSVIIGNLSNPTWLPTYNPNARILYNETNCTCDGLKGGDCSIIVDGQPYLRCLYDITDKSVFESVRAVIGS
jgi:ADP-heptose:LPS heptosyltransferase